MLETMGAKGDWSRERERERERERKEEEEEVAAKRLKLDDATFEVPPPPPAAFLQPYDPAAAAFQYYWHDPYMRSAFRPWHHALAHIDEKAFADSVPAYLSHDPPVLLHPERVVPMSESERFERTYQPNVALAPRHDLRRNEVKTESVTREEKKPLTKDRKPYNPEIELSTDTDDSASDQHETGSAVEQVATVFAALSDAKETTRELVVSLVERLAGRLESMEAENRRLREDNLNLHQQISKEQQAKLRERLSTIGDSETASRSDKDEEMPTTSEADSHREMRPKDDPKAEEHGKEQGKVIERDKPNDGPSSVSASPAALSSALSSEAKPDLFPPHVSVVRSSPVSVITSQASIKMEPLSE